MIFISIGNAVAWLAAIYVKNADRDLLGNVVVGTVGAFIAGYLSLRLFPAFDTFGMIAGACIGAVLLILAVRQRKRHWFGKGR